MLYVGWTLYQTCLFEFIREGGVKFHEHFKGGAKGKNVKQSRYTPWRRLGGEEV
jgi:hypothetical protein